VLSEDKYLKDYKISDYEVPLTTVDMGIFSIIDNRLSVLLLNRDIFPEKDKLALPGGFIDLQNDPDLEATALRKLKEKTGVKLAYLEQVETVGSATRDPRGWSVTILYFALIDINKINKKLLKNTNWHPVEDVKSIPLAFDHNLLLEKAVKRLRSKTLYTALPIALLPKKFTLTELQTIFEIILGKKLPVKSFRRRLIDAGAVVATDESKISGKRPAQLYQSTGLNKDFHFPRPLQE
jgi:ADP-ribose pyrophosphatase YjhB (NUDIX family)